MPAFADMDLMLANCFDDYGSDAVVHDLQDDEHNYWVDVNVVSVDELPPEYLISEEDDDDRILADDPDDPPAANEVAALVEKFSRPTGEVRKSHPVFYKGELPKAAKGFVAVLRYDPKARQHVLGREVKVSVRKHRHLDLSTVPYREYFRPSLDGIHVL